MTAQVIKLEDGTEVQGVDAVCEGCGSTLAEHACKGSGPVVSAPVYVRRTGPRAAPTDIPTCAHCGGRIHQNLSGAAVTSECIVRQYALDKGLITDPVTGRLPVATIEMWEEIVAWSKSLATPLTYGKMESAAGGAGTYSGLRPKTGRKKKVAPAAPGSQIQDMAEGETVEVDGEAKPGKGKGRGKGRK